MQEVEMVDSDLINPVQEEDVWSEDLDTLHHLLTLLNDCWQSVSLNTKKIGKASTVEMKIELPSERPVFR